MNTTKLRQPQHNPRQLAQKRIRALTAGAVAIPLTFELENKIVSISDLAPRIHSFRHQKWELERYDLLWPAVSLNGHWVPLDLAEVNANTEERIEPTANELKSGRAQQRASWRAELAGLEVKDSAPNDMDISFADVAASIVSIRLSSSADQNLGPPMEPFTVTTDSPGLQVLFADGYFVSTQQGFGISTPASRRVPWGLYSFGVNINGTLRFDSTVWKVPDVTSLHLGA